MSMGPVPIMGWWLHCIGMLLEAARNKQGPWLSCHLTLARRAVDLHTLARFCLLAELCIFAPATGGLKACCLGTGNRIYCGHSDPSKCSEVVAAP